MFGKLRFRSWSIGAKTLVSHLVLALTVKLSVCLLACALQLAYVRDMLINELMARARSIAAMTEVHEGGFELPKPESIRAYQELINAMVLYVHGNSVENQGGGAVHTGIAMPKEGDVFVRVEFDEQLDKEVVARVLRGQEFSAMRIEYAAQLLARGATPGEVAAQMGYCSGAYFSQKFHAATGNTPSAYRRMQQGLPARRQNRQQKDKEAPKTSIPESDQKK